MQEAAAVRAAALDAVDDVDPQQVTDRISALVDAGSMAPGVFTVACARTTLEHAGRSLDDLSAEDAIAERAAGVQLIYEGLAQTRRLAHENPWAEGDADEADLDILVADILVARGFYLLARTEASSAAVEVVRAFGRDQTVARETDKTLDSNLERDVFELAAVAGTTAAGTTPTPQLRELAAELGNGTPEATLPEDVDEQLTAVVSVDSAGNEGVRTSADH
ncbi:DUF7114 family protein [Halapricum salinum]|uniref:Polyprenyl synthetase n=1 Tax=Halapricum salinum TaxID=1457250 RepID=A0A4D6HBU1_9EURY|nr:hypothetical protein [Halapricum salinum]QCC51085.1 hypothetical protein DV733_07425 [Halapricum salinum]